MRVKTYLLFLFFSILILLPFILDPNIIKTNDLNGNIVPLIYFRDSLVNHLEFVQWNPYINQGIPQIADPLYGIYNPIIGIPALLFPPDYSIKIIYVLSAFVACISMFYLLRLYKISFLISFFVSLTYTSSSYLAARINAGHLEKIVSFGFLPLLIFCIVKIVRNKNLLWSSITGLILSFILFSGDIYNAEFSIYAIILIFFYYLTKDKKISLYLFLSVFIFLLFSAIKILPMVELQSYISKLKNPFAGSENLVSIFYYLFYPFDSINKIIPIQFFLSNDFGWWENFSFIGTFSFIGVVSIFNLLKRSKDTNIIPLLFILFVLISMPSLSINPFHILISNVGFLQFFHVPGRIFAYLSMVVLVSFALFLNSYIKKRRSLVLTILILNALSTFMVFQTALKKQEFSEINKGYIQAISFISKNNPNNSYALHLTSQGDIPQDVAYHKNVFFLQSNYGLIIKGSPSDKYTFGKAPYNDITPKFIITDSVTKSLPNYIRVVDFNEKNINIYSTSTGTSFASVDNKPYKANISVNRITVVAETEKNKFLSIIQNSYPGWKVTIDGKPAKIIKGEFLSVKTISGYHKYEFIFNSNSFIIGFLISAISLLTFGYLVKGKIFKI